MKHEKEKPKKSKSSHQEMHEKKGEKHEKMPMHHEEMKSKKKHK